MTSPWGGLVDYREVTASTMDDALALEQAGAPDGSLVWAGVQTSGRGRNYDRRWEADAGQALLMTVFWRPARFRCRNFAPSLIVGLAVCLWLESLLEHQKSRVRLKWPNDVYIDNKKVAGILVRQIWSGQTEPRSIHAGIGINLQPAPANNAYRNPPISLAEVGITLTPSAALESLLPILAAALEEESPQALAEARLWKRGEVQDLKIDGSESQRGRIRGLDDQGRLLWENEQGMTAVWNAP